MKPSALREQSDEQLADTLKDVIDKLFKLRVQAATERLDAPSEMRKLKKDIARIKTLAREREIQKQKSTS